MEIQRVSTVLKLYDHLLLERCASLRKVHTDSGCGCRGARSPLHALRQIDMRNGQTAAHCTCHMLMVLEAAEHRTICERSRLPDSRDSVNQVQRPDV